MRMDDMITYLENRGFEAEKKYIPERRVYLFTISKGQYNMSGEFKYPETRDELEKNDIQKEFLLDLMNAFTRARAQAPARHNGKAMMQEWLKEDPFIQYCQKDVESIMDIHNKMSLTIKDVIFHEPATIVFWMDGTKTVVKCQEGDVYDPEKGLAMAITKKALGNQGNYCNEFRRWVSKYYTNHPIDEMHEYRTVIGKVADIEQNENGIFARIGLNAMMAAEKFKKALMYSAKMMSDTNYYDFMTVKDLKEILNELPEEMLIVIPVVDEENVNNIYGFRKVRTAGILGCGTEECSKVLCLNGAANGQDIADQIHFSDRDVDVLEILYGKSKYENTEVGEV